MHIKQNPEDFQVEEMTRAEPGAAGDFAFYRLEKRGWTTPDALAIVKKRWKIDARRISVGGLKDRHAQTIQYLTIFRGPQRKLTHANLQLTHLGQLPEPYDSGQIEANRFAVTVRAVTEEEVAAALVALDEVRVVGIPNYYDDQRFGSVASGGEFLARQILLGQHEDALRLALTAPYAFERSAQKKEKSVLRRHWGAWWECAQRLPRGGTRKLIEYLAAHPDDFRGALERLPAELRTLYLSAYQSHLWNRMLADWLADRVPRRDLLAVGSRLGDMPMPRHLEMAQLSELRELHLPLHSARLQLDDADPRKAYFERILKDEGVTQEQFKLKGFRAMFFSKGERPAWCIPDRLDARSSRDDKHPGKRKLALEFLLPRGSYATLVIKRITRADMASESQA